MQHFFSPTCTSSALNYPLSFLHFHIRQKFPTQIDWFLIELLLFLSPLFNSIWVLRAGLDEIFFALNFYSGLDTKTVCYLFCFAFHDISIYPAELKNASDSFHATKQIENFSEFLHTTFLLSLDFSTTRSYDVCGKAWILSESRKIPLSQERKISLRSFASASHQQRINSFHFESKLTQFASRFHISFLAGCWERVEIHLVFVSIRPGLDILVTGELVLKMVWNETQIFAICFPYHWTRTALACWLWCAGKWRENVNIYFIIMPMMLRCCCWWWWYGRSWGKWHTKSRRKWQRAGCCRKFTRAFRLLTLPYCFSAFLFPHARKVCFCEIRAWYIWILIRNSDTHQFPS